MTDIATRVASLLDDRLLDLHKALDEGDPRNPADVEAHHLVAVEMLRRGHQHGHTEDPWATAAIVTDEVQVDGPDDIEAPEGLSVAWEGALSKGGTVSIVLTTDGYVLKAQPSVNEVHHVEEPEGTDPGEPEGTDPGEPEGTDPGEPEGTDPGEPVEKSWDDADVLTALTSEDRAWFATVATVLDSGGDPDLLVAKGNPEPLRDYWRKGGNGKVNWGAGGDFTSCAAAVAKYMTVEEAKGYCAIRHRETTGMWPGDKRNRAQKAAADMTGILTLPDGSTYTFSPEPVAKHGSPGRPGYSQLHGGGSGGGAPRATAVDIKSGTASSNALPKAAQKRLRQELNRGTLVDTYGSSFERGREHKTGRDRHGEPITTSGGGDPVRHHREQRDSALATLDAMPLRSGASDSWAAKVATHQGFIDGATGARPMFPRSHTFGETLAGLVFGGLSGATKASRLVEDVAKHGSPGDKNYARFHPDSPTVRLRSTTPGPDIDESTAQSIAQGISFGREESLVEGVPPAKSLEEFKALSADAVATRDPSRFSPRPPADPATAVDPRYPDKPRAIVLGNDVITPDMSLWHHLEPDQAGGWRLSAERRKVHEAAAEAMIAGPPPPGRAAPPSGLEHPTAVFLGGGPAAGKTTAEKSGSSGIPGRDERVTIAADHAKFALPEFAEMIHEGRSSEAAGFLHEESSVISKMAQQMAQDRRQSMVVDGLGNSNAGKLAGKVERLRADGYSVLGRYATVPTDVAVSRAATRGERTGFVVSADTVRAGHINVSRIAPNLPDIFDNVQVYFTDNGHGQPATLIATASRGEGWSVQDQGQFDAFVAKGSEPLPAAVPGA